jgi:hypothetical protein
MKRTILMTILALSLSLGSNSVYARFHPVNGVVGIRLSGVLEMAWRDGSYNRVTSPFERDSPALL